MTTRLLYTLLASLTLAAPAFCQHGGADSGGDGAPQAPAEAPTGHSESAASRGEAGSAGRLYIRLDKGGEVIFRPVDGGAGAGAAAGARAAERGAPPEGARAPARKPKYKGYSKKGLAKYKKAAAEKRLAPEAVQGLEPAKAEKAKELAAEAEMNEDVRDTIKEKLEAAGKAGAEPAEKDKLMAADEAAKSMDRGIKRKMKDFEDKEAGGKKVFKEPAAKGGADGTPADSGNPPDDSPRR